MTFYCYIADMDKMTVPHQQPDRLSLTDLTREAGVSVRTVRYYIAEGLLPPPLGAGPHSAYTLAHLDRLRLIGHLKAAYLPLREIRRRLAGLDDAGIAAALSEWEARTDVAPTPSESLHDDRSPPPRSGREPADSAAAYLARLRGPTTTPPPRPAEAAADPEAALVAPMIAPPLLAPMLEEAMAPPYAPSRRHGSRELPPATEAEVWRRVALADGAELLIRDDAYARQRDRIDWLVDWARRVFD